MNLTYDDIQSVLRITAQDDVQQDGKPFRRIEVGEHLNRRAVLVSLLCSSEAFVYVRFSLSVLIIMSELNYPAYVYELCPLQTEIYRRSYSSQGADIKFEPCQLMLTALFLLSELRDAI